MRYVLSQPHLHRRLGSSLVEVMFKQPLSLVSCPLRGLEKVTRSHVRFPTHRWQQAHPRIRSQLTCPPRCPRPPSCISFSTIPSVLSSIGRHRIAPQNLSVSVWKLIKARERVSRLGVRRYWQSVALQSCNWWALVVS